MKELEGRVFIVSDEDLNNMKTAPWEWDFTGKVTFLHEQLIKRKVEGQNGRRATDKSGRKTTDEVCGIDGCKHTHPLQQYLNIHRSKDHGKNWRQKLEKQR